MGSLRRKSIKAGCGQCGVSGKMLHEIWNF